MDKELISKTEGLIVLFGFTSGFLRRKCCYFGVSTVFFQKLTLKNQNAVSDVTMSRTGMEQREWMTFLNFPQRSECILVNSVDCPTLGNG